MEMSVSSEMTFFTTKQQSEICPHLRPGSSAEDRGRIDTREGNHSTTWADPEDVQSLASLMKFNLQLQKWEGRFQDPNTIMRNLLHRAKQWAFFGYIFACNSL